MVTLRRSGAFFSTKLRIFEKPPISAGPIKTLAAAGIPGFSNILQVYRDRAPLRRTVDTSEVADAAIFLISDASRAITAEIMMVDAGFHATGIEC